MFVKIYRAIYHQVLRLGNQRAHMTPAGQLIGWTRKDLKANSLELISPRDKKQNDRSLNLNAGISDK